MSTDEITVLCLVVGQLERVTGNGFIPELRCGQGRPGALERVVGSTAPPAARKQQRCDALDDEHLALPDRVGGRSVDSDCQRELLASIT